MNEALRKLRIKFVALIMVVVTVILTIAFSIIVSLNYTASAEEVSLALEEAVDHARMLEESIPFDKAPRDDEHEFDKDLPRFEIGGRSPERSLVPIAVYELGEDGSLTLVSNAASGTMSESLIDDAGYEALQLADGKGFLDSLGVYYLKESYDDDTIIAFADEQSVSGWKSLAFLLAGIGLAILALFFVLSLFFSRWALRPVEASWRGQQRFIADASHELKTPLTVIAADVAILKRHPERTIANQSQWIESIEAESAQMRELVGDMLLLASADAQEKDAAATKRELVDLSKLVNADILQFEPLAYERKIALSANIATGAMVVGDKDKLQRLVSVLFDNAFKYMNDKGSISIELALSEAATKLSVCNTGTPVPSDDLPHLFDRFYRADKARARNDEQSYGLGLSIAYEIVQAHGGSIDVSSSKAAGTTFTVVLPLA
jgi:signal transduction histidine kinase